MRRFFLKILMLALCPLALAQQTLNNDAVIKLSKAGLSDDLIITTINASPGTYDTTTDGLIALKKAKVSDKVVSAIVLKASGAAGSAAAPNAGTGSGKMRKGTTSADHAEISKRDDDPAKGHDFSRAATLPKEGGL